MAYGRYIPDGEEILPRNGERLEFGVHRMGSVDRACPMWPANPAQAANARFAAWRRGAKKDPHAIMLLARVKAGEVFNDVAATIIIRRAA